LSIEVVEEGGWSRTLSYNACNHPQPKPLNLCGYVFDGRALKQSESFLTLSKGLRIINSVGELIFVILLKSYQIIYVL